MGLLNKLGNGLDAVSDFAEDQRQHRQETKAIRRAKRELPAQAYIADAFHRKLFNRADFDYLIDYLRRSGIASCENIYTLKTISRYVANVTYSALKSRSPATATRMYATVLKLCARRRKGLLVFLDLYRGKAKKIVQWETFVEYAGFKDPKVASQITVSPYDLFPGLRSGTNKAKLVHELSDEAKAEMSGGQLRAAAQSEVGQAVSFAEEVQQENLSDEGLLTENIDSSTGMFEGDNVNTDKLLVALYNQAVELSTDIKFTPFNAYDITLFLAGWLNGYCHEETNIHAVETALTNLLASVNAPDLHTLAKGSSKEFLHSFRRLWGLPEGDGSSNDTLVKILQKLLRSHYSSKMTVDTNFHEVYDTVVGNCIRDMNNALNSRMFLLTSAFPQSAESYVMRHNSELLSEMYAALATDPGDYAVEDSCLSDAIMCMILCRKTRMSEITIEQYVALTERLFFECGIDSRAFTQHLEGSDLLPAIKCFRGMEVKARVSVSDVLYKVILQLVKDILGVKVSGSLRKVFDAVVNRQVQILAAGMTNTSARNLFD